MNVRHIVAVAGASCSGKTTVVRAVAEELADVAVIGLDSYYYDLSDLAPEDIGAYNLDEPAAIEHSLLVQHIKELRDGNNIEKPVYDHKTHSRSEWPQVVLPRETVLLEGLFVLHWPELRALVSHAVFIDAPHEVCLGRRIERDRNHRGRNPEQVTERYQTMVEPMYERWVRPTREYASLIVDGTAAIDNSVERILDFIRR